MSQESTSKSSVASNLNSTVTKFCGMLEGQTLPHITKFRKYASKITDRRDFQWLLNSWIKIIWFANRGPSQYKDAVLPA